MAVCYLIIENNFRNKMCTKLTSFYFSVSIFVCLFSHNCIHLSAEECFEKIFWIRFGGVE